MRAVSRLVRPSDRKVVLDALKRVYRQENAALAKQELSAFLDSYGTKYKRLHKLFQNESSLFSFYEFPKSIQQTIYTSNLIENNNKGFRHKAKLKEQFPTRIRWNDSPAWSTVIITDVFPGKRIADFKKHIRSCWRCSRIDLSVYTIKVYT